MSSDINCSDTDYQIVLDVDGTIAGFASAFVEKAEEMGLEFPRHYTQWRSWSFEGKKHTSFSKVWPEITESEDFWLRRIDPLQKAHVPYDVGAYVSARSQAPEGATEKWIQKHGFPSAPVVVVERSSEKPEVLREIGADVYVDDKVATVEKLHEMYTPYNDIPLAILITTPANSRHSNQPASNFLPRADYLTDVPPIADQYLE